MLLYETLSQPIIALIIFLIGFGSGFIADISNYLYFLFNNNKYFRIIIDIITSIICFVIFFISIINLNYGEFRLYLLMLFIIGFLLQRFTIGKIIAKISNWCYNKFKKIISFFNYGKNKQTKEENINR